MSVWGVVSLVCGVLCPECVGCCVIGVWGVVYGCVGCCVMSVWGVVS